MHMSGNRFHKVRALISALILAAAVGLILYGIYIGEAGEVFRKAVTICLECIGVG